MDQRRAAEESDWTNEACSGDGFSTNDKSKSLIRDHACAHMVNESVVLFSGAGPHTPIDVENFLFEIRPTIGQGRLWNLIIPPHLPQHLSTLTTNIRNDSNRHRNRPPKQPNPNIFYRIFEHQICSLVLLQSGNNLVHDPDAMVVLP